MPHEQPADVSLRHACELFGNSLNANRFVKCKLSEVTTQKRLDFLIRWFCEKQNIVKPAHSVDREGPMVCRGNGQRFGMKAVKHLQERVNNSFQFTDAHHSSTFFSDGIKFIEEQQYRSNSCVVENLAKIRRCFTEKRKKLRHQIELLPMASTRHLPMQMLPLSSRNQAGHKKKFAGRLQAVGSE